MLQIVWCSFYCALFIFIIRKSSFFRLPGITPNYILLLFLIKILSATILWKVFTGYFPDSDATVFFSDSKILYNTFFENPVAFFKLFFGIGDDPFLQEVREEMLIWNNTSGAFLTVDSRTMIRLHAVLHFFSFGNFYVHAIIICFFSFIGLTYLYKLFFPYFKGKSILLAITCFLIPSVVFWSSTVLKEGILFLGIGLMLYHCQCGLRRAYDFRNITGFLVGIVILIFIKIYVLIAMCPALIANFWIANSNHTYVTWKYAVVFMSMLLFMLTVGCVAPALDVARIIKNKQTDFTNVAKGGMVLYHDSTFIYLDYDMRDERLQQAGKGYKLKDGYHYASFKWGKNDTVFIDSRDTNNFQVLYSLVPSRSSFAITKIKPTLLSILKNAPLAFVNTLVVPPLFTMDKTFSDFILIENILLLCSLLGSLFMIKKEFPLAMILFCGSFAFVLFALIGLTTPVLGALVRYRIPGMLFLFIMIGLYLDEQKMRAVFIKLQQNVFKK